ncbi:MAG: methionyl-tRNA formyltransferase [Elusimicrobia bacterium]|nr:methionyl-tRNA formyltransferase [Elusimicrobiota bacterium]
MKLLFFGTPKIAVPFLQACAARHEVLAAVTKPDSPSGRGLDLAPSPVKAAAAALGIRSIEPQTPSVVAAELTGLGADLAVVVAYGKILKPDVLAATKHGFMNVHFSLLPKYRGAAPIAWSLIRGETRTGVSLFWLDEGMDTGPVQLRREAPIGPDEDAPALAERLTAMGVEAMIAALADVGAGKIIREAQSGDASLAPKLTRKDAAITFDQPAVDIHNRVRGLRGGPRAYFERGGSVTVLKTALDSSAPTGESRAEGVPGAVVRVERNHGVLVQCRLGRLWLVEVQPEGKKQIPAADFVNGLRLKPGDLLITS